MQKHNHYSNKTKEMLVVAQKLRRYRRLFPKSPEVGLVASYRTISGTAPSAGDAATGGRPLAVQIELPIPRQLTNRISGNATQKRIIDAEIEGKFFKKSNFLGEMEIARVYNRINRGPILAMAASIFLVQGAKRWKGDHLPTIQLHNTWMDVLLP